MRFIVRISDPMLGNLDIPCDNVEMTSTAASNTAIGGGGGYNPNVPNYYLPNTITGTSTTISTWPTVTTHDHLADEEMEYVDGTVFAKCAVCGDRIQILRVPGGLAGPTLQALLGALVSLRINDSKLSEVLGLFSDFKAAMEAEEEALEEIRKLFAIAQQMLNVHLNTEADEDASS